MSTTATLPILKAVNGVVDKARKLHEGIPEVTIVLGASGKMRSGMKHGHFAPKAWKSTDDNEPNTHEVLLSGESLARGAEATVGTILHELAHAYAHDNEIKDTSNNGRYHNKKFKEIGEKFGISLEQADTIGWSVTSVPAETAAKFGKEIGALDEALKTYRVGSMDESIKKTQKKYLMQCPECQDAVVVTKKWFERNEDYLYCHVHEESFEMIEEEN